MRTWAESKQIPGQFTGSTGVKVLTPAELSSGYQAWARKVKLLLYILFHSDSTKFVLESIKPKAPDARCIFKSNLNYYYTAKKFFHFYNIIVFNDLSKMRHN